jgi:hypothetical protein
MCVCVCVYNWAGACVKQTNTQVVTHFLLFMDYGLNNFKYLVSFACQTYSSHGHEDVQDGLGCVAMWTARWRDTLHSSSGLKTSSIYSQYMVPTYQSTWRHNPEDQCGHYISVHDNDTVTICCTHTFRVATLGFPGPVIFSQFKPSKFVINCISVHYTICVWIKVQK